jgi:hypothetical protein
VPYRNERKGRAVGAGRDRPAVAAGAGGVAATWSLRRHIDSLYPSFLRASTSPNFCLRPPLLSHPFAFRLPASWKMQRAPYQNPPPAHSPPLHHPVPQHVSTVPQLRSPPLQQQQPPQQPGYGYGQQGGAPGATDQYGQPAFGNFINDPTAQMGLQMGRTAFAASQEYMGQNVRWTVGWEDTVTDMKLSRSTDGLTCG